MLTVRGDRNYSTMIDTDPDGSIYALTCNCEKGLAHKACVHMAASIIYLEGIIEEHVNFDFDILSKEEKDALPESETGVEKEDSQSLSSRKKASSGKDTGAAKRAESVPELPDLFPEMTSLRDKNRDERRNDPAYSGDRSNEEYRYFHPEKMDRGITVDKRYLKAADKILSGDYQISVSTGFMGGSDDDQTMIGWADLTGKEPDSYYSSWNARIFFDRDSITSCSCRSAGCYDRDYYNRTVEGTVCAHTMAGIKAVKKYLSQNNIGDNTNASGLKLMNRMSESTPDKKAGILPDIRIEPVIDFPGRGREEMSVIFRAGTNKLYIIKDLSAFVEAVSDRSEYTFGKNSAVKLDRDRICEDSRCWYDYIESRVSDLKRSMEVRSKYGVAARRGYYYGYSYQDEYRMGKEILLDGRDLDDFFDIANGRTIDCKSSGKNAGTLAFCERKLPVKLTIRMDNRGKGGSFDSIILTGDIPSIFAGDKYNYFIENNKLVKVISDDDKLLGTLLEQEDDGEIRLRIGRNHLRQFYNNTLPALRKIAEIDEPDAEKIAAYTPPTAEFVFYLDLNKGTVILRVDVCYGAGSYSLIDYMELIKQREVDYASVRDRQAEGRVSNCVAQYFTKYDNINDIYYTDRDDEAVFRLLDHGIDEFMSFGEVYSTERFKRLGFRRKVSFQIGVSYESDLMDLKVTSDELSPEDLMDILNGYRSKSSFVKLKNGDFVKIDEDENVSALSEMLDGMGVKLEDFVKGRMHIPAYRALYIDKMLERMDGIYADRDRNFKRLVRDFESIDNSDFEIPTDMKDVLRNYQRAGYRWLRTLDHYGLGGILADDMGLGKTLQTIAVIRAVNNEETAGDKPGTSLIVCPASLCYNWGEEFSKFSPDLKVALVLGTQSERADIISSYAEYDVLVTSYDLLKRDIDRYKNISFRFEVIDEAQYIKNHNTEAAKSVKIISAKNRFALTGTPIENRLSELWSIFDYLMPGMLFSYPAFRNRFEIPIVRHDDRDTMEQFKRMVQPFILRRVKGDVLRDLPDKLEEIRYTGMEDKQRRLYDAQVVRMRREIEAKDDASFAGSKIEILAELTRIRQICCDPGLCFEDYDGASAKREACLDLIRSLNDGGHKMLIFSQFTSMLSLLEDDLMKEGIEYYKIIGETSKEKRAEMVKAFNEDSTPVFLISLKAGGTGLNLTGADSVIHYDPWWNTAAQDQATDRAHRIGQTRVVTVYKLIQKNTIEEKIIKMQEQKKKLADDILSGESISGSTLSREDLLALLEE